VLLVGLAGVVVPLAPLLTLPSPRALGLIAAAALAAAVALNSRMLSRSSMYKQPVVLAPQPLRST
jgi:hypothetical protein